MTRPRLLLAVLAAFGSIGASLAPRAASGAPDEGAKVASAPQGLEIVFVGPEPSLEALTAALTPLLSGDGRISWRRKDGLPAQAEGRQPSSLPPGIWIEAAPNGVIRIVAITDDGQPAVRVVDAAAPSPVSAEIVAQIVRETAEVLLAREAEVAARRRTLAIPSRANETPQLDPPTTVTSSTSTADVPRRFTYAVGLAYVSRTVFSWNAFYGTAPTLAERGFGTSFAVLTRAAPLGVSGALLLDRATISTPAGGGNVGQPALDITRWSVRAMVGPVLRPLPLVEVGLAVGAGFDRVAAEAGITGGGDTWVPAARGTCRLSLLFQPTGLELAVAATLDLKPHTFFTQTWANNDAYEIYSTNRVQPGFSLGLGWRR